MSYSFACADTGASCPGAFATETKDELLAHLDMHAKTAHPETVGNAEVAGMIAGLIKTG